MNQTTNSLDVHIEDLFPGLHITEGSGTVLTSADGSEYLSFYTGSLRWLCGYNSPELNERLNRMTSEAAAGTLKPEEIADRLKKHLLSHTSGLKDCVFTDRYIYGELAPLLEKGEKKLFLVIGPHDQNQPEGYESRFIDYRSAAAKEDPAEQYSAVLSQKVFQKILKRYKGRLAGVILTIIQPAASNFIAGESALMIQKLTKRARIPFIVDEQMTCPYRTGTFYAFTQFALEPDIIVGGGRLYGNRQLYFAAAGRKIMKKDLAPMAGTPEAGTLANCLMFLAIIDQLDTMELPMKLIELNHRLSRKLRALEANSGGHFDYRTLGSLCYLNMKQRILAKRTYEYLYDEKVLVLPDKYSKECLILAPPLSFSGHDIDSLIDVLDDFFKNGIRLPSKKLR